MAVEALRKIESGRVHASVRPFFTIAAAPGRTLGPSLDTLAAACAPEGAPA